MLIVYQEIFDQVAMLFRTCALLIASCLTLLSVVTGVFRSYMTGGDSRIVRVDPRFDQLISTSAKLEKLADGFRLAEGPVWSKSGRYLLFSDLAANTVYKWAPHMLALKLSERCIELG